MKRSISLSIVALAAFTLATPTFAQQLTLDLGSTVAAGGEATGNDLTTGSTAGTDVNANADDLNEATVSAGGALSFDANGDGTLDADELGAVTTALEANGNTNFVIDANGDGTLDASEAAALSAALSGSAATGDVFDTDGDGIFSPDEQVAAVALLNNGEFDCSPGNLASLVSLTASFDVATLDAAENVNVVVVNECDAADVTAALASQGATNIRSSLDENATVMAAIEARGYQADDVLGATLSGDTVTIYVVTDQSIG